MPKEIRYLSFSRSEVIRAATEYLRKRRMAPSPGTIVGYRLEAEPEVKLVLTVAPSVGNLRQDIELKSESLGAALVLFCIEARVPTPARAVKTLFVDAETLILALSIGLTGEDREMFFEKPPPLLVKSID